MPPAAFLSAFGISNINMSVLDRWGTVVIMDNIVPSLGSQGLSLRHGTPHESHQFHVVTLLELSDFLPQTNQ